MKEILNKLKSFFRWLLRWIKYFLLLFLSLIYSLFKKEEKEKIETAKKELKTAKKENINNAFEIPFESSNNLIKNSIFKSTKEIIKEEILLFYCKEKNIKKYELEKQDEKIIEYLEEKLMPIIEKEIIQKHIKTKEDLKEKIKKLGTDELLTFKMAKNISVSKNKRELFSKEETLPLTLDSTPILKEPKKLKSSIPIIEPIAKKILIEERKPEIIKKEKGNISPTSNPFSNLEKEEKDLNQEIDYIKATISHPVSPPIFETKNSVIPPINKNFNEELQEIIEKTEEKQEDKKEMKNIEKKYEESELIVANVYAIENEIKKLELKNTKLEMKTEFEDKNYDEILLRISQLIKQIETIKILNLKSKNKKEILDAESKLKKLQNDIENKKEKDLIKEKTLLEENITEVEISKLLEEVQKLYLEHQIDLNKHLINKAEELENLNKETIKKIEKELIKEKIKKASKSLELPSIILLPFIRNRYFFMFTIGIFVNNHLNILDHLLKHKSVIYIPPELKHIKKGSDALENALNLTNTNLSYLDYLEQNILAKYPELSLDEEYLLYINKLRYSLLKNEEKLLKKKKTIEKYNLKYQIKIRKLKKKKKVA